MITYTGLKNGRPSFVQDEASEAKNKGCMPAWLVKALDEGRLKLVDGELKAGVKVIAPGEVVGEL